MKTQMTENEGFAVIEEMITRARSNFDRRNAYPTLFWGYVIGVLAAANAVLLWATAQGAAYLVWLLVIPAAIAGRLLGRRWWRKAEVVTHIDRIVASVWRGFMVSTALVFVLLLALALITGSDMVWWLMTPVVMVMVGLGSYATAAAYRSRAMKWRAVIFWAGALVSLVPFSYGNVDGHLVATLYQSTQQIILAVVMVAAFIIPSHCQLKSGGDVPRA